MFPQTAASQQQSERKDASVLTLHAMVCGAAHELQRADPPLPYANSNTSRKR